MIAENKESSEYSRKVDFIIHTRKKTFKKTKQSSQFQPMPTSYIKC